MAGLERGQEPVLFRGGDIGMVPGDALAILDHGGRCQPGIHHRGVLAVDQRAERRAQHSFQEGRLEDDAAQRVLQLIHVHACRHYGLRPVKRRDQGLTRGMYWRERTRPRARVGPRTSPVTRLAASDE